MTSEGKRVKRWAPKVFSGCLTCKRRRIKCDETKPHCLRCHRSNLQCEGYAPPQPRIFEPNKKGEHSRQSRASQSQQASRRSSTSSSSLSPPTVASRLILDADDQQSFDFYMRETVAACSVYSRRHFWAVIVPQASLDNPAVKHSLLALSLVHEAIIFPWGTRSLDDSRLLHHYNAAIRAITQGQPSTDIVLITSMMFFFIDFFRRGGTRAASHHMEAAINILDEFKATENHIHSPCYETISIHIQPIIQMFGICMPTGDISVEQPAHLVAAETAVLAGNVTASQAVAYVKTILRSLLHLSTHAVHVADLKTELDRLQMQLFRGLGMLGNLGSSQEEDLLRGRLFLIHHAMAYTFLRELKEQFEIPETLHDDGIIAFYTFVINRLETYISMPQRPTLGPTVEYWPDLGVIAPLFATVVRSPDEELAERALRLLRTVNCTEGPWTSGMAANIAEALAQADIQDTVGFDLSSLTLERKPYSLHIYAEGQEAACDHYLPLSAAEMDLMDLDAIAVAVHHYGYQFDQYAEAA